MRPRGETVCERREQACEVLAMHVRKVEEGVRKVVHRVWGLVPRDGGGECVMGLLRYRVPAEGRIVLIQFDNVFLDLPLELHLQHEKLTMQMRRKTDGTYQTQQQDVGPCLVHLSRRTTLDERRRGVGDMPRLKSLIALKLLLLLLSLDAQLQEEVVRSRLLRVVEERGLHFMPVIGTDRNKTTPRYGDVVLGGDEVDCEWGHG